MRRRVRGHNLLEMIIACFIFSTVAIGLTTVWIQHSRTMMRAGGRMVGQFLANQVMEECIAAGWDSVDTFDPNTADGAPTVGTPINMNEIVRDSNKVTVYTPSVNVERTTMAGGIEVKMVTVRVEWDEQEGRGWIEYSSQLVESGL